jgi:transposase
VFDIRDANRIAQWKGQYDSGGIEALTPRRRGLPVKQPKRPAVHSPKTDEARTREDLLKELNYLRMENAYLKKLDALIQADKLAAQHKKRK